LTLLAGDKAEETSKKLAEILSEAFKDRYFLYPGFDESESRATKSKIA
jgi:hypothetical protein